MADEQRPDAVLFHERWKSGKTLVDRLTKVQKAFGPVLGGDQHTELGPEHGGRVHTRDVGGGWYLSTLSPLDSLLFSQDHEFAKQPRYTWKDVAPGVRYGYLVDEAKPASPNVAASAAEPVH